MRLVISIALMLLTAVAPPRGERFQLHEAARLGDLAKAKALLEAGIDVNTRNRFGATPLWFAAYKDHPEVVKLLLAHKADPNLRDDIWNYSPLGLASSFDSLACARLLLAARAKGADEVFITSAVQGKADLVGCVLEHHKPPAEILSAALLLANAREVKEKLRAAGANSFAPPDAEQRTFNKMVAGSYENANGVPLTVRLREGVLVVGLRGGPGVLRSSSDKQTFRVVGNDTLKLHVATKDGKVERILVGEMAYTPKAAVSADEKPGPFKDEAVIVRNAKNWPSFRGEGASGVADGQHPPGVWDLAKLDAVGWKTPIPGLGHSCPVLWGDRLFLTTAVSTDPKSELKAGQYGGIGAAKDRTKHAFEVYCLDRKTGKILWKRLAHEGVPLVKRHTKATHANATAATDGQHLIVSFASEGLYCYDLDGKLLWKQDLGLLDAGLFNDPEVQWEAASSPIIYRDRVLVQCDRSKDSYLAAFRLSDGKQLWRTPRDEVSSWGTPTVVESKAGVEIVTNGTNAIRGYDPDTGKELWTLGRNSQITVPTPFVGDGLIYVTSGYAPVQPIYAIWPGARGDLTLKDNAESSDQIAWSRRRGGTYMPTPIYYRGHLYTCSNAGVVTCYEGRTGKQVYQSRLSGAMGYTASPIAADGRLYFTGEDGKVSVVEAGPKFRLLAVNDVGDTCLATPAIMDGKIYIRTKGYVLGIGRAE